MAKTPLKLRISKEKAAAFASRAKPRTLRGTVLIVDDEHENLFSLQQVLEREYRVLATTDPDEALAMVREHAPDVVLTDQRMPTMSGTELLAKILEINRDNTRMILTGYTDAKDLITCINDGLISRYLVKPWTATELEAVVRQGMARIEQKRTISKLVPHQVIDRLYAGELRHAQAGEGMEMECAILFLDIRGFTTFSERVVPREAFRFLTSYMSVAAPLISRHHGFIDKFLGDGMLAIFDRDGQFAADALSCAVHLVEATEAYNQEHRSPLDGSEERDPIEIGIGLTAGRVMLGTVGFEHRLEFTVLGDAVNTAHRIQELTKSHGCRILADASLTRGRVAAVETRDRGRVLVRGRGREVELLEVVSRC